MKFRDRTEAGQRLADALVSVDAAPCVITAIPRGGVAVALPVVERLRAPLTVTYARKLTAPTAPEFAFGAIDEDGETILDRRSIRLLELQPKDIEEAKTRVAAEIQRRMALYEVPPLASYLPGAAVILVDDGLATGLTMRAAVAYARRHRAREVVVAAPCASTRAVDYFRREADRVVCLCVDPDFTAVGNYYADFAAVPDAEVKTMLARARMLTARAAGQFVSFKNAAGLRLAGELLTPDRPGPHPVVVFAHGFGSSKASPRNRRIAEALVAAGLAAFVFDFTGHGDSEGTEDDSTLGQQIDDLRSALDVLGGMDEVDTRRLGVAGASSGAAAALALAADDRRVRALVLRSGNPSGADSVADRVQAPTLLVVGSRDAAMAAANDALLARLGGDKRLEIVAGGDHLFSDAGALARATTLTLDWFRRYLG